MLGWFTLPEDAVPGAADRLLEELAGTLQQKGARLAGAVQVNRDRGPYLACDMDVYVIGDAEPPVRISQNLGAESTGCRLDPGALETAAVRVSAHLHAADLVILPKFGKQEAIGRGFYSVISQALLRDIPVLLHVPAEQQQEFSDFHGGLAAELCADTLENWCHAQLGRHG